jgi:DNA adenine methylase
MKPIIKYQGGKSRELSYITTLLPPQYTRVIEPFAGGAAVTFHLGKPAILNDINTNLINLYTTVADTTHYTELYTQIETLKTLPYTALSDEYYKARSVINSDIDNPLLRAYSYIVVRQLCFSGMERYNNKNEFNVAFGHYKRFTCTLSDAHHILLQQSVVYNTDFTNIIPMAQPNDFMFIDPPYMNRLGYSTGNVDIALHTKLYNMLTTTPAQWMIVHTDCELYRDLYKEYTIHEMPFTYAQRFGKGKNHSGASVKHLYITNYTTKVSQNGNIIDWLQKNKEYS